MRHPAEMPRGEDIPQASQRRHLGMFGMRQFWRPRNGYRVMLRTLPALVVLASAAMTMAWLNAANAQTSLDTPPDEDGRYLLQRTADGFFRVDRFTGAASVCRERAVGWTCQLVPDDRDAFEDEISRLVDENARLRDQLAALDAEPVVPVPLPDANDGSGEDGIPTEQELDQVMDTFERMMRRFFDMARELQNEFDQAPPPQQQ